MATFVFLSQTLVIFDGIKCFGIVDGQISLTTTVVQSVASPTADPGVPSLIPAWYHTFVEIDHDQISMVILLLPLIQEGLLIFSSPEPKAHG